MSAARSLPVSLDSAARISSICSRASTVRTGSASGLVSLSRSCSGLSNAVSPISDGLLDRTMIECSETARVRSWCLRAPAVSIALIAWSRAQREANAPNGPRSGRYAQIARTSPILASWAMSLRSQPHGSRSPARIAPISGS